MKKLLLIVGPTATGKTSLGLQLAHQFNGEILSADSRQIYKDMDIGTGKDIPNNFNFLKSRIKFKRLNIGYYCNQTKIWLVDLVKPDQEFNIAYYRQIALKVIKKLWREEKLPIVVGGTGLYFKALTEPLAKINIPPNKIIRKQLATLTLPELQTKLQKINPLRFKEMNLSDRKNPRRLIRAIEVSKYQKKYQTTKSDSNISLFDNTSVLWIGLEAPRQMLYKRIDERVDKRVELGIEKEIKNLLTKGYTFNLPSMSALGYKQWQPYFEGKENKQEVIERWKLDEHAYARRQFTWFKKNPDINWFSLTDPDYKKKVVRLVKQWYSVF
jgi:tRNA dimethylallyltransferase